MFIGHHAVAFASKKFARRASLGVLIAAPILLDILWPIFLLLGWEQAAIQSNPNPFLRFDFIKYPISHGLVAAIAWAILFASIYFGIKRYVAGAIVVGIAVISHWLLDFVVHRPDLPLYAGSRLVGLGLWNHRTATLMIEVAMFVVGISIYLWQTKAKDRIGTYGFWPFVVLLLAAYAAAAFGPPPSLKAVAIGNIVSSVVMIPWAWWFDSHRELRTLPARAGTNTMSAAG